MQRNQTQGIGQRETSNKYNQYIHGVKRNINVPQDKQYVKQKNTIGN